MTMTCENANVMIARYSIGRRSAIQPTRQPPTAAVAAAATIAASRGHSKFWVRSDAV
jgi:hypothetical protein